MLPSIRRALLVMIVFGVPFAVAADCMGPYPPSMVKAFNQNCAKDAQMVPFCTCIMDEVQKNIPLADFIEIGNSQGGINSDPRFVKASQKCSSLLSNTIKGNGSSAAPATGLAPVGGQQR